MALYRPRLAVRILVELLMRVRFLSGPLWRFCFRFLYRNDEEYIDDLDGFTFFMDGNARVRGAAKRFGIKLRHDPADVRRPQRYEGGRGLGPRRGMTWPSGSTTRTTSCSSAA